MALLRMGILLGKVLLVILFFMLVRWTWPRFRFDQLMNLAWKVMLPLGLVNLVAVAAVLEYEHAAGEPTPGGTGLAIAIGWGAAVVAWIVAAWLAPLHTDNRPRIDALAPPAFEPAELLARERQITTT
jgi:NADH-quinone oxidoreductase subunit H